MQRQRTFYSSMRLRSEKLREVMLRLGAGDSLKEYPTGRILLHTADFNTRTSVEVNRNTVDALTIRGLVVPIKSRAKIDDVLTYELTDDGQLLARVCSDRIEMHE